MAYKLRITETDKSNREIVRWLPVTEEWLRDEHEWQRWGWYNMTPRERQGLTEPEDKFEDWLARLIADESLRVA